MKTLTHSQFRNLLAARAGAAIVGIEALTDAGARKTGNPFPEKKVLKQVRVVGFVGADYEKAVQREGDRQGASESATFEASPLKWGQWDLPGKVITHGGKFYLRTQSTPGQRNRQPARLLAYRNVKGEFLSKDAVAPFLPEKSESAKQARVGLEGAASQVMVRTYAFDSIRKVRVNGETFELVAD